MADRDQRLPVRLGESSADAEVAGVVDGRLGPERAALFEVLLDLRGAEMDLDRRLHSAVEDLGVKPARGPAVDAPAEHDRGLVGATERELVGQRPLKPGAPGRRPIEHPGVGDLQLPERERMPVPALAVLDGSAARAARPASAQSTPARRPEAYADLRHPSGVERQPRARTRMPRRNGDHWAGRPAARPDTCDLEGGCGLSAIPEPGNAVR